MRLNAKNKKFTEFFEALRQSKTWLVMRITVLFLFLAISMATAKSYSQRISLKLKNTKMETVLSQIEKQSGYSFIYERNTLKNIGRIDVSLQNTTLTDAMSLILKDQPLDYSISNKFIVISPKTVMANAQLPSAANLMYIKITGVVKDTAGVAIPGVSVLNKRTRKVVSTDGSGNFSLDANPGDVLSFSFIGFARQEYVLGEQNHINIILKEEGNVLEQVVVTAMGIKKSTKALTYNVQEIKSEELTRVPDASFINSLSGKVAGITINSSASGIGGSTRVVMRGDKSIFGNNNALYVLDGIPLPNLFSKSSTNPKGVYGGGDSGDGISSLNPEDFVSVSVLTGAASAALYGSQAANGVILITTKKGSTEKTRVSFSNSSNFYRPFVMPEFQNTYGTSSPGTFDSWGAKLGEPTKFDPADFFQTGHNVSNSISLSTGTEKNQTYFSAASANARGIIPNNTFDRYNLTLHNTTSFLDDRLTVDLNLMYMKMQNQNMISQGQYFNPIVPLYLFPRGDDIEKYKAFERYNPERNFKTQFWPYGDMGIAMQNPYWITNRDANTNDKDRYMLGASVNYKVLDWLSASARVRMDNTTNVNEIKNHASTLPLLASNSNNGSYLNANERTKQTYADFLLSANKTFSNFGLNVNAGASLTNTRYDLTGNSIDGNGGGLAVVPNLFNLNNVLPSQGLQEGYYDQSQAIYGNAQLNYKSRIFLDFTARNEWSSALANTNKLSFFYPSVGLSAIISDMVKMPENIISFLKIRGSYSEVGNTLPRFITRESYPVSPSGITLNSNLALTDLKPERTKASEVGINAKFLNNAISLDVTLYSSNTLNQLFTFKAPDGSGVANYYVNAGKVNNRGIEAALGYSGNIGQLKWNSTATFTLNRNKVKELVENYINPITGVPFTNNRFDMGGTGSYRSFIEKGGSFGDIYVNKLAVDHHGYILLSSGALAIDNNNLLKAGNANPRYNIGFRNSFSYKNFNLAFLIDSRIGGVGVSATQALMDGYGTSKASADARDNGGAIVNGFPMDAKKYYETVGLGNGVLSQYVYSATNVRLREASLGYTIPAKVFGNKLQDVTVSLIGRNLFMFYNKAPFDPESTASTGTYFQGIDYFMLPSLRSIGFSVKVNL